jgi:hypothetical protein
MLVGGIILFVVALGVLIYCIVTRRSFAAVIVLFVIAIIMIAYPKIVSFTLPGGIEVKLAQDIKAVEQNPNDQAAKARLAATVNQVKHDPSLTPNTRLTLAKAQALLGQQDEAKANVKAALKAKPNLKLDSRLRALAPTSNPSG